MRVSATAEVVARSGEGAILPLRLRRASGGAERAIGLLGRASLASDEGFVIGRCGAIHTVGMRFAIDVVFLDAADRVVRVAASLPPWRLAWAARATTVLELAAGASARLGIREGTLLALT